ncbi:MAG: hypothetical protein WDN45_08600 [Caulobacteraceae bacterium]
MALGAVLASIWLSVIPLDPKLDPTSLLVPSPCRGGLIQRRADHDVCPGRLRVPTETRGAGIGWAVGIGRIGSIVSPIFGIYLLNAAGPHGFFHRLRRGHDPEHAVDLLIRRHMPKRIAPVAVAA